MLLYCAIMSGFCKLGHIYTAMLHPVVLAAGAFLAGKQAKTFYETGEKCF